MFTLYTLGLNDHYKHEGIFLNYILLIELRKTKVSQIPDKTL
jgi:hypothetical protein